MNRLEKNKARYKNIKNRTNKEVTNPMRKKAQKMNKSEPKTNHIFKLMKFMKKDGKDVEKSEFVSNLT